MSNVLDQRTFTLSAQNANTLYNAGAYSNLLFNLTNIPQHSTDSFSLHIALENISFPSSWFALNENTCRFYFVIESEGLDVYDIVIDESDYGNYDAQVFVDLLNTYIQNIDENAPVLLSYNYNNNRIIFTWQNEVDDLTFYPDYNVSTMRSILGLTTSDSSFNNLTGPGFFYFKNVIDLSGVTNYIVQIVELPLQNYSTEINAPFFVNIPNTAGTWGITMYTNTTGNECLLPLNYVLQSITFKIYNQRGNLINFNGIPWQCTLKLTYVKKTAPISQNLIENLKSLDTEN